MSNAPNASFYLLPVEILYRIFDSIDAATIVFALRITCRRFKAIVDGYDRYAADFRSMSKCNFQLFCRLIDPQKVISLILSPMEETLDQIELFTSYFRARQFTRLRSLTLININENQLKIILKRFRNASITLFSFKLGRDDGRCKTTTAKLLSSFIAQATNLHYLDFDISSYRVEKMTWPAQCTIKYLKIGFCSEFDQIFKILRCSPYLQTIIINFSDYVDGTITSQSSFPISFKQLTSLTLENVRVNIDDLELLLSLMPSLTHLKLIGFRHFMDGNRWEQFIQTNLPFLNQFELFVQNWTYTNTPVDIKSILPSFQTPFWVEHKKWFFTCECGDVWPRFIKLYSIPICVNSLNYESESKKTSLSTFNSIINDNVSIMDNVNTIQLKSSSFTLKDVDQEV
jgi:hypothetical protein